ncbi:6-phosphogluconolactonase [bacterium BMS3Abin02]|nr:6-phosphogluconolactonase [bacterium BMS3Abin02]GBE22433.1 6-phosphogluconolactonase [bacterium BMS3Bbin01]
MQLEVFGDAAMLAEHASSSIAAEIRGGMSTLGLAGGNTPRATYERLRSQDVPWDEVVAWLPDERWVPPGHPDRNATMASTTLFDHVPATLLEVPWVDGPEQAASLYEEALREVLPSTHGHPSPDLVLLGLGDDGHTASLFPGTTAVHERDRLFVANWVPAKDTWRLTATLPLLWSAKRIIFLVSGAGKARALKKILQGAVLAPAARMLDGAADVVWMVDEEAARLL